MPQRRWTAKDERQYDHVRESVLDRGGKEETGEEIAARTVNKQRRMEGRTQNRRSQGTGNPSTPISQRTRDELYNIARERRLAGRSKMTKQELVGALAR